MNMVINSAFYCFVTLFFCCVITPSHQNNEEELLKKLLQVSPHARPVLNESHPVDVFFGFELLHIVDVDVKRKILTLKVWVRLGWKNKLMIWNPKDYGGVDRTRLGQSQVWTPDIYLLEDVDMSAGPMKYTTDVMLRSDGTHLWYNPVLLQSSCGFDLTKFPFDLQSCKLVFTPWTHDQSELNMKLDTRAVVTTNYINSSDWDIVSVQRKRYSIKYACCKERFVDIRYMVNLIRKPLFYVNSVVAPCFIQMVIILFTFFLPPESGERIGLVITVILVFAVYLQTVNDNIPKTSSATPALLKFYITIMAESACALIATCLVLIFHFKGEEQGVQRLPAWLRRYVINGMAKFLWIRRHGTYLSEFENDTLPLIPVDEDGLYDDHSHHNDEKEDQNTRKDATKEVERKNTMVMETLIEEVQMITKAVADQAEIDKISREWQMLSKIFDRLFFVAFFIIFLISSLSTLRQLF